MITLKKIFSFYIKGFKEMSNNSRKLWLIIFIKLFIMFAVLKIFFFKDYLGTRADSEHEKAEIVIDNLTKYNNESN